MERQVCRCLKECVFTGADDWRTGAGAEVWLPWRMETLYVPYVLSCTCKCTYLQSLSNQRLTLEWQLLWRWVNMLCEPFKLGNRQLPNIFVKFLHASRGSDGLKASIVLCNVQLRTLHKQLKCSKLLTSVESGKERYMLKEGANLRSYGEDVYKDPVPCERITSTAKSGLGWKWDKQGECETSWDRSIYVDSTTATRSFVWANGGVTPVLGVG